ncbi:AlwI family type II restriction endonuclease [Helicobacter cetorum]|uniref:AlwI family type II restriction endonuclease n=1 Tax=Helicobacter cetorum TaxID=138563 RepID=UPI000CF088C6|nr:AlwI family type II restriction endonuclease [Helicobacter cetorum]
MAELSYQSFCWVIGTTSFRVKELSYKIIWQCQLLQEFQNEILANYGFWQWDNVQSQYYDFLKEKGFLSGDANRKDKDARQKTSGLVDIGLLTKDRQLSKVGKELLQASSNDIKTEPFLTHATSLVFLKQLLKTNLSVGSNKVAPFMLVLKVLDELEYLSFDEFKYFVPLMKDKITMQFLIQKIKDYRLRDENIKNQFVDDMICECLIQMQNYKDALKIFLEKEINIDLICKIGMNRKSKIYDMPYYDVYITLSNAFFYQEDKQEFFLQKFLKALKKITNNKIYDLWLKLIFAKNPTLKIIKQNQVSTCLSLTNPFLDCKDERSFKQIFFKYLHVFKAKATLEDYFDLNCRYFNLSDIIVFENGLIRLDILPKHYFKQVMDSLSLQIFKPNHQLEQAISLEEIIGNAPNLDRLYRDLSLVLNAPIKNQQDIIYNTNHYKKQQFITLIENKFSNAVLLKLLQLFKDRNNNPKADKNIFELVTDEANIPTIFEYIIGIIWYKISQFEGDLGVFLKLSLQPNLLPKTHAKGGEADIIFEYAPKLPFYHKHCLLLEVTLTTKDNQRRMELEPHK